MPTDFNAPPIQDPLTQPNGAVTRSWVLWFNQVWSKLGRTIDDLDVAEEADSELEALLADVPERQARIGADLSGLTARLDALEFLDAERIPARGTTDLATVNARLTALETARVELETWLAANPSTEHLATKVRELEILLTDLPQRQAQGSGGGTDVTTEARLAELETWVAGLAPRDAELFQRLINLEKLVADIPVRQARIGTDLSSVTGRLDAIEYLEADFPQRQRAGSAAAAASSLLVLPALTDTPSADQNDYSPSGLADANLLRVNASASIKLTGLATGASGRVLTVLNASTDYLLWLEHESASSSAANRFTLPQKFPAFLFPGDAISLIYDGTASRWVVWNWPNRGQAMGLGTFCDFVGEVTNVPLNSEAAVGGIAAATSGTAATIQASAYLIDTTEKPAGVIQLDTGSTSGGQSLLGNIGAGDVVPAQGAALSVVRLAVETAVDGTNTFTVVSGFADLFGGTWTDGVGWEYRWTGAAVEWSQTRLAAAAATRSNTGSPAGGTTYIWLVVFVNPGWTRADFIYSTDSLAFTKAASPTTGLPSSAQPTTWCAASIKKSAGTTVRNVSVDLAGYRVEYARG